MRKIYWLLGGLLGAAVVAATSYDDEPETIDIRGAAWPATTSEAEAGAIAAAYDAMVICDAKRGGEEHAEHAQVAADYVNRTLAAWARGENDSVDEYYGEDEPEDTNNTTPDQRPSVAARVFPAILMDYCGNITEAEWLQEAAKGPEGITAIIDEL